LSKPDSIPAVREWKTVPPIITAEECQALIGCKGSHLDDLVRAGLPVVNVGFERRAGSKGTGRTRRMLRFEPVAVIAWLRARNGGQP